jgi:predicted adenine nucleotide alpha hydrolase (AANH) superfamily ATPase
MNLLLHTCCANCALVPIGILKGQFNLTLFWYNPNIYPQGEHEKRLKSVQKLAEIYQLPLIIDAHEDKKWFELTKDLEGEPEGGRRCEICFKIRLEKTATRTTNYEFNTNIRKFNYFATTLGISKHKNTVLIDQIGQKLAEEYQIKYYPLTIDKNLSSRQELELSKKYDFCRQRYCGCLY